VTEYQQVGLSRIVSGNYSKNPLCSLGSIRRPPGGRFNFGSISSAIKDFQCLYLASDFETAFAECYHHEYDESVGDGDLSPDELFFFACQGFWPKDLLCIDI